MHLFLVFFPSCEVTFGLLAKHLLDVWEFLCHTSQSFEKRKYQLITVSAHNINWSSPEFSGMPLSYINLEQNYKPAAVYNSWECSPIIPNFCSWKMLHFQLNSYYVSFPPNYLLNNWVVGDQNASSLLWLIWQLLNIACHYTILHYSISQSLYFCKKYTLKICWS